jgi:hypothetical protein
MDVEPTNHVTIPRAKRAMRKDVSNEQTQSRYDQYQDDKRSDRRDNDSDNTVTSSNTSVQESSWTPGGRIEKATWSFGFFAVPRHD